LSASGLDERVPGIDTVSDLSTRLAAFTTKRTFTQMAVHPITGELTGCGEASYMPLVRLENRPHLMGSAVGPVGANVAGNEGNPNDHRLRSSLLLNSALLQGGAYGPAQHSVGTCRSEVVGIHKACGHAVDSVQHGSRMGLGRDVVSFKCPKCDGDEVRINLLHAANDLVAGSQISLLPTASSDAFQEVAP
jgi:hypothetical protein